MERNPPLLATLVAFVLLLAACGASSEVGTASNDVPGDGDVPADSLPLVDEESTEDSLPTDDTSAELPVPDAGAAPTEVDGEHVIINNVIVNPQLTNPAELVLNPENDSELWVRFIGGDPNCTAAQATVITETPEAVQVELFVGITEDALARSCVTGEFNLRVDVPLNESAAGKTLGAVQVSAPETPPTTLAPNANDFIGLPVDVATAIAEQNGITTRIVRIDDDFFPVTEDFIPDRVSLEVDDGIVTAVSLG